MGTKQTSKSGKRQAAARRARAERRAQTALDVTKISATRGCRNGKIARSSIPSSVEKRMIHCRAPRQRTVRRICGGKYDIRGVTASAKDKKRKWAEMSPVDKMEISFENGEEETIEADDEQGVWLLPGMVAPGWGEKPRRSFVEKPFAEQIERVPDWRQQCKREHRHPEQWIAPDYRDVQVEMRRLSGWIHETSAEAIYAASRFIPSCEVMDDFVDGLKPRWHRRSDRVFEDFSGWFDYGQEPCLDYAPTQVFKSHGETRDQLAGLDSQRDANENSSPRRNFKSGSYSAGRNAASSGNAASNAGQISNGDSRIHNLALNETRDENVNRGSREGRASDGSSWQTIASEAEPGSNDEQTSNDHPESNDNPDSNDNPASNENPGSNDNPESNDNPQSNANQGSDDDWESCEGSISGKGSVSGKESSSDKDSESKKGKSDKDPVSADDPAPNETQAPDEGVISTEDSGQTAPATHGEGSTPRGKKHIHWRPSDEIVPSRAKTCEAIPNSTKLFHKKEQTTLREIRDRQRGTLPRVKAKARSLFEKASTGTTNNQAPAVESNNQQGRAREQTACAAPAVDSVETLMDRRNELTGRKINFGTGEVFWYPMAERTKSLYYMMDHGDGSLEVTINDIGDLSVEPYDELKEDVLLMQWLIDMKACQQWSFSVHNFCCKECLSARNIMQKRAWLEERYEHGGRRYERILCPHQTKISRFFEALGISHTKKINKIKLLINVDNCFNPDTIASAVHVLTMAVEPITEATVEFHHRVGRIPPKDMLLKYRKSIVRSLRQLETWIGKGDSRIRLTGLENHKQILADLRQARKDWFHVIGTGERVRRRMRITISAVHPNAP